MLEIKKLSNCLCCNYSNLIEVLDLGEQPLANSYKKLPEDLEPFFPLKLNFCKKCTHLQLSHAVNPDLLFKNYLYVSGTTNTLREYFDWFAKYIIKNFHSIPATVLDIACNDGSQLNALKSYGIKTYGIDPAKNLYSISSKNHEVVCDYFTEKYINYYKEKNLDIIIAQNVFAHVDYPLKFLDYCEKIMNKNSLLFIQTSQADMIKNNEFDTIYHEHISFFTPNSMKILADRANLNLIGIEKTPIHGTSYIFILSKSKHNLLIHKDESLFDINTYINYSNKCHKIVKDLNNTINKFKKSEYIIAGYGAAAKGNTLLNFGNIELDFIIDDNPLKQGLYTPGKNIHIVSVETLKSLKNKKLVFVPLAWNFFEEIRQKIKLTRSISTDLFIKYFPEVKVIE